MTARCYEPFDPRYAATMLDAGFAPILDHYFRPRLIGASRLPADGPLIVAANHSGTAFPFDAMALDTTLWRRDGFAPQRKFRTMFEKELALRWWMRPFGIDNFWRRAGAVDQTFDNFDELLARGDRVIYYPEGVPGIGKGFQRRYQLQEFKTSFVVLAARHDAPVFPVHIVNAEWIMPFNFTWRPLDRFMQRVFGVPFLPLPFGAVLPLCLPFTWWLAFPARLVMVVGKPIDMAQRLRRLGVTDFSNVDRRTAKRVAEEVRAEMQRDLQRHVRRYGRWPYQIRSLRRHLAAPPEKIHAILPFGWAPTFVRLDRDLRRAAARNRLLSALRDWDLIAYFLPLGWPVLALARALRRPPYGYRGMEAARRRDQEGAFHWHLAERPLPSREEVFEDGQCGEGDAGASGRRRATRGATARDRVFA